MWKLYAAATAISLISAADEGFGQNNAAVRSPVVNLTEETVNKHTRNRNDYTKRLIQIVRDSKKDRDVRTRAVRLLGILRATEAVDALIEEIDKISPSLIDEKTTETIYPCVPALISIGKPAAKKCLRELRTEDSRN